MSLTDPPAGPPTRHAAHDPRLIAQVIARRPLRYDDGPDPALDRPGHVRAASAVVAWRGRLLVVQDDAEFVAAITPDSVQGIPLPPGPGGVRLFDVGRGNKAMKLDLEAAALLPGSPDRLIAFGSGSAPARERLAVLPLDDLRDPAARLVPAPGLYAAARAALAGLTEEDIELNIEGAVLDPGGGLRLLQRGNGAGAVDAILAVAPGWLDALLAGRTPAAPRVSATRWVLGDLAGVRLTFTDATPLIGPLAGPTGGLLFVAAAEDSPDAVRDGEVVGSAVGWLDGARGAWAPLTDRSGRALNDKVEGVAPGERPGEIWLVTDADDPDRPADLLQVSLRGPWPAPR